MYESVVNTIPLRNPEAIRRSTEGILKGDLIVTQLGNNFGYLANPADETAVGRILNAKNDMTNDKPFSAMLQTKYFLSMIDFSKVPAELHDLLEQPKELEDRLGLMCHLRAPVLAEVANKLPPRIVSWQNDVPYVQNFFIAGHSQIEAIRDELFQKHGKLLSVTTQNRHDTPEITTLSESLEEGARVGVSVVLTDEVNRPEVKGSWAIINLQDLTAARDGCIPIPIISMLLGAPISTDAMNRTNHVQDSAFLVLMEQLEKIKISPTLLRNAILLYLSGIDINGVLQIIASKP